MDPTSSHPGIRHKSSDKNSDSSSKFQVSVRQQKTSFIEVNDKLEVFVNYFVKEFEAKLLAYHLILEGVTEKAGKHAYLISGKVGQGMGGAIFGLIGFFLGYSKEGATVGVKVGEVIGEKIGSKVGNEIYRKKVTNLLDLIDLFQKDKTNFRRVLVEAAFDVFQSFELQFMRVATDQGQKKAIQKLAKDATNRAISYMKRNKDISISKSVILGVSKREAVHSVSPGYKIQYEYQSNKKVWNTASVYDKAGVVIEDRYYKNKEGISKTTKYGYRRLLVQESWDKLKDDYDSDNIVESKSVQFTDYQYVVNPRGLEEQSKNIFDNLNNNDIHLGENRIKNILKEVKKDLVYDIDILKEQSNECIEELISIKDCLKNLKIDEYSKKFEYYFKEIAQSIEERKKENREGHTKTQEMLSEFGDKILARLPAQETQTECIMPDGLGITKYYYMSRKLNRHIQIKDDFKKEKFKFFVTGSSQADNLKPKKNQDIVTISKKREDFEKLCKEYKDHNIHWFKEIEKKFIWQHSQGSLSELRMFLDVKTVQRSEINKISDIKDKVVIISAGPGMGKSTLLTYLAAEQRKVSSTFKVIRINLNEHTDKLSVTDCENTNNTTKFLREITGIKNLDLKSSIFLFDGFDEISSNTDYKGKVIKIVSFLKSEAKNVWVTTRPYAQHYLEDKLSVFSYSLEPLSDATQKEFLEKFWKTKFLYDIIKALTIKIDGELEDQQIISLAGKIFEMIELEIVKLNDDDDNLTQIKRLISEFNLFIKANTVKKITDLLDKQLGKQHTVSENVRDMVDNFNDTSSFKKIKDLIQARAKSYAEELIAKFSESVSDKEREFTGVPLQVRMLAEAFQEKFLKDFNTFYDLKPNQHNIPELPERLNLLDLYERFIENKHRIYFVEKGNTDLTKESIKKQYKISCEHFMEEHRLLALSLLFSEGELEKIISKEEKDKIEILKKDIEVGKENTGIAFQIINGKPHFIHRTFAEYFTADFFVKKLKETNREIRNFLRGCIFQAGNEVIRHFFDRMLVKDIEGQNQYEIHRAVLNNDKDKINELLSDLHKVELTIRSLDKGERTALHIAAAYGYLHIIEVLLKHGVSISTKDKIFAWRPLSYADKGNYWDIAELLLQNEACGDDMFEAKKNVDTCYEDKRRLLHIAAQEGYIQFAKVLVDKLNADFRATDSYNNIPLHLAANYGKLEIVEFLLNKDRITARSKDYSGKTPLDLAVYRGQLKVVDYLGKKLVLGKKELDEMQLNAAASNGEYKIVDNFLKEGLDVNSEVLGWTPLHQAAKAGNLKVVQLLVQNGANIGHRGNNHPDPNVKDGWTPLHGAANNGHYNTVKFLVEQLLKIGADINPANNEGYTPLHTAAQGGHLNVVKYFIEELGEKKVNINVSDIKGTTPLQAAVFHGWFNIVEYLIEKKANINAIDNWGATIVFTAALCNDQKILNFLLDRQSTKIDSDKGIFGKLGMTVLHVAAIYGASDIVQRLVEDKNSDVNAGENTFTPLHLAALSDSTNIINYLISKGANVNALFNFSYSAKVIEFEGKVLKDTSMETIFKKLFKFCNYIGRFESFTPFYIYKLLKYKNVESLALLKPDRGLMTGLYKEEIATTHSIHEKYFNEENILDPPQEMEEGLGLVIDRCLLSTKKNKSGTKCSFTWDDANEFNKEKGENEDCF